MRRPQGPPPARAADRPLVRAVLRAALLSFALIAAVPSHAGNIEAVLFTEGGALTFNNTFKTALIDFINSASATIDVAVYNLADNDVISALNAKQAAGVTVRVVTDGENVPISGLDASISVKDDGANADEMHHKFVVIDAAEADAAVWTGSANFTTPSFSSQNNNALIIRDPDVAAAYKAEFENLFTNGKFHQTKSISGSNTFVMDDGTAITLRFSPGMGIEQAYADLVSNASSSFYYAIFTYNSSTIANATIAKVALSNFGWFEEDQALNPDFTQFDELAAAGNSVEKDGNPAVLVHHKFLVVDEKTVATGSYNFTVAADQNNDENSLVIQNNAALAERFIQEINRISSRNLEGLGTNDPDDTSAPSATARTTTTATSAAPGGRIKTGPNPFRIGRESFHFISDDAGNITRVEIYDLAGTRIHAITPTSIVTEVTWDGRTNRGDFIASGIYLYRVESGGKVFTGRFTAVH